MHELFVCRWNFVGCRDYFPVHKEVQDEKEYQELDGLSFCKKIRKNKSMLPTTFMKWFPAKLHNFVAPDTILVVSVCTDSSKCISSWLRLSHIEPLYSYNGRINVLRKIV